MFKLNLNFIVYKFFHKYSRDPWWWQSPKNYYIFPKKIEFPWYPLLVFFFALLYSQITRWQNTLYYGKHSTSETIKRSQLLLFGSTAIWDWLKYPHLPDSNFVSLWIIQRKFRRLQRRKILLLWMLWYCTWDTIFSISRSDIGKKNDKDKKRVFVFSWHSHLFQTQIELPEGNKAIYRNVSQWMDNLHTKIYRVYLKRLEIFQEWIPHAKRRKNILINIFFVPTTTACCAASTKAWTETILDDVPHCPVGQSVSDTGRPGQKWWNTDFSLCYYFVATPYY